MVQETQGNLKRTKRDQGEKNTVSQRVKDLCYREEKQSESETLQQRLLQGEIFHTDNEDVPGSILDCYLFADISR